MPGKSASARLQALLHTQSRNAAVLHQTGSAPETVSANGGRRENASAAVSLGFASLRGGAAGCLRGSSRCRRDGGFHVGDGFLRDGELRLRVGE